MATEPLHYTPAERASAIEELLRRYTWSQLEAHAAVLRRRLAASRGDEHIHATYELWTEAARVADLKRCGPRTVKVSAYNEHSWAVIAPFTRTNPRIMLLVTNRESAEQIKAAFRRGDHETAYRLAQQSAYVPQERT